MLGDWPSIVNGGCRFALQARITFLEQVRIFSKSNISWNHGRILLSPGYNEIEHARFGIPVEYFQEVSWTEPIVSRRGLKRPVSMQAGMLDFNPACVQPAEVSKFCSANNRIQRFAIVEWSIMNPEKIVEFFDRMRKDSRFRNYYNNVYDPLRIVYKMLFDEPLMEVGQSESQWSTKLERVLVEERQALERCREEIIVRESRVAWLKHVQADE